VGTKTFKVAAMLAIVWLPAAEARAQRISTINCTPSMVASVGINANGDRNGEQDSHSADASVTFEAPVTNEWSARAEAGAVAWTFQRHDAITDALLQQERVGVQRFTLSAIHRLPGCGAPFRPYGGLGIGVYRYRYPDQQVTVATGGIHALFGADIMVSESFGISPEVGISAINGPRRNPVFSTVLWSIRAAVGVRILF
jgi:hypothetical protein